MAQPSTSRWKNEIEQIQNCRFITVKLCSLPDPVVPTGDLTVPTALTAHHLVPSSPDRGVPHANIENNFDQTGGLS